METFQYNADVLLLFPLIENDDADFVTDYTPAAGDAKVWTDTGFSANPTALILGFDSLSELPAQGAQIDENGAGTAEGVIAFTVIVSGTVGGGDAAGFFFLRSVTGQAWSDNDQIDINGGTANIATADSATYDLAATAGLIAILGNGQFAACLSPTEMSCKQGHLTIVDSATKVIEDQAIHFRTAGNASAYYAYDPFDSVRLGLTALPNAAADAAGGLVISDTGGLDMDLMDAAAVRLTAVRAAVLTDWIDGGRLDLILDTLALEATVAALNDLSAAQVNAEVDLALTDIHLDHLLAADYDPAAQPGVATALLNELVENNAGVSRFTAAALTQAWAVVTRILTASTNFNDLSAADVNAEMVDVVDTDTITLPGQEAPPLTPTMREMQAWLYKVLRNRKDMSSGLWRLYADDESTVDAKATVSDSGGLATKQEIEIGP